MHGTFLRTPNTQTASWFLDLHSAGRLDLDPPYQRRSVWNTEFRAFFVDSMLRNYPTQSIFLEHDIDPDRPTQYKVLDGKQRLTTLILYTSDGLVTPNSAEDLGIADKYYSDLPTEWKKKVLQYLFTIETVSDVNPTELNEAFDRLNRNVARLNKQELRHARFGGVFIKKMEELANDELWRDVGLVTPARIRRMLDVEYVSELYIICLEGIQDGKNYLDDIYASFDNEIPAERQRNKRFRAAQRFIRQLNDSAPLAGTRFSNVADFYSVWAAVVELNTEEEGLLPLASDASDRLLSFEAEIDEQSTVRAADYLLAARQGSNKASNRIKRARILKDVLTGG